MLHNNKPFTLKHLTTYLLEAFHQLMIFKSKLVTAINIRIKVQPIKKIMFVRANIKFKLTLLLKCGK